MNKSHKKTKLHKDSQEHARQASYEKMAAEPKPATFSARMPAYCYTVLCPVPELREGLIKHKR